MAGRGKRNAQRKLVQSRKKAFKEAKQRFMIFCEGANTEPEYFKAFRLVTANIKTIHINKGDALNLVKEAVLQKNRYPEYDQYWVVFDKDETTDDRFNKSLELAKEKGLFTAYSNQAFEYWYLLHYKRYTGALHRMNYAKLLEENLGYKYEKRLKQSKQMYNVLYPYQQKAIKNAKQVYSSFGKKHNPALEESSTTVYKLVEELNKYL